MATIWIDGKDYQVSAGQNLLEAVLALGLDLPYFCWHPAMGSIGSCRQCAVIQYANEEDSRGRLVMGCMTPVSDGMRLSLNGETARGFRKGIIEALMVNHPHDCPVCAEGGECHLQDMTVMTGHRDRRYRGLKNTYRNQYLGPFLNHEMNRCITCYRCVRFYRDYAGGTDLVALASSDHVYFGRHQDGVLQSEFAGNLVEVCPTGVFTDKPLVHDYTRKWDLQSAPSVCAACAVGCNTMPGERYGRLKRIHNRYNDKVNGYFLCDRGRFGGAWANEEARFSYAGLREADGGFRAISADDAIAEASTMCSSDKRVAGIGSPRASLEVNATLRRMVDSGLFCDGIADQERPVVASILRVLKEGSIPTPTLDEIERADAVLILGEDVSNTAPRLALALRQSVRNAALNTADEGGLAHWQDAAVRNLAQDDRSPLYQVTVAQTRLAAISRDSVCLTPQDIARVGFAIAAALGVADAPLGQELSPELCDLTNRITADLRAAKSPLIISGSGCLSTEIVHAAGQVAAALHADNSAARLYCCAAESNTLGSALLSRDADQSLSGLLETARRGEIDTLLVVENDVFRRAPSSEVELLIDHVPNLIVLDVTATATCERATLALPASSVFESEGTLVSAEGRGQRYFPVLSAQNDRAASWQWLSRLARGTGRGNLAAVEHFDQLLALLTSENALPAKCREIAPMAGWRSRAGTKVPRQPHRYSGRTAMRANVSVHEPKQEPDDETALAFSMEGDSGEVPGGLMPFVWAPGWNSNQSLHKFQSKPGGTLKFVDPGCRLIEPSGSGTLSAGRVPEPYRPDTEHWLPVPLHRIFGSDELSALSPAIAERAGQGEVSLHPDDANVLSLESGDGVAIDCPISGTGEYPVRLDSSLPRGCVGLPVGLSGYHQVGRCVPLRRVEGLAAATARLIASDAAGGAP